MNNILNLYEHNIEAFNRVLNAYNNGEDKVAILQATGTGKSYVALRLAYEYKDKKVLYISPSEAIIEHIKNIINNNGLDINRDFLNLKFRTYQSLINLSREEIVDLDVDLLITDELHHLGAPVWGNRINTIVDTHPNMLLFGMSAYNVRDRGTIYERDMTNPDTDELFSGKVVNYYDLCDAMIDGVLPKPIYRSAYVRLYDYEKYLEDKIEEGNLSTKDYTEYKKLLLDVKRKITNAPSIPDMVRKNIKNDGKYIYFCPPITEEDTNDIDTIMNEVKQWFDGYDVVFYKTTSKDKTSGKLNREAFYNDRDLEGNSVKKKLRIMFAINQYNEGVHAPDVDGVILGRGTTSDIVYFEQIGRALAVKGKTKEKYEEYDSLTRNELIDIAKGNCIDVSLDMTKEEIIDKLLSPVIIDLTNNIEFIEELENNLKNRVKEIQRKQGKSNRKIKIRNTDFDINIENKDLYEILRYVRDRINPNNWDMMYELAKKYYEHYGNLKIPNSFKTVNGYEINENGYNLGKWINRQRVKYKNGTLSEDKIKKLEEIGMIFKNINDDTWNKMRELAKKYYEHYGDLKIPRVFKTINGYDIDENGYNLGEWISRQRVKYNTGTLSEDKIKKLEEIGMIFGIGNYDAWNMMYELAKKYYEHYGNLKISINFKTVNGYDIDENGYNLGDWIRNQRVKYKNGTLSEDKIKKLEEVGMIFENVNDVTWNMMYELAKKYYKHYGDLKISRKFKTINGYDIDENGYNFGEWISRQRVKYKNGTLSKDKIEKLEEIGMIFGIGNDDTWNMMYQLAKKYYEHYGDLKISIRFKTINGYDIDENGYNLGFWIVNQRVKYKNDTLSEDKIKKLEKIGMIFENVNDVTWNMMYELAKKYYKHYGDLKISRKFKTINGYDIDENGYNFGEWISNQRVKYKKGTLSEDKIKKLEEIGMIFENVNDDTWNMMYELAKKYYKHYGDLKIPRSFKTINGYKTDENGYNLGTWISSQKAYYKKGSLSEDKIKKLEEIGMIFKNINDVTWNMTYELAKKYYKHYGDLKIPRSFKTVNGYEVDEKGYTLGAWINTQRFSYKKGTLFEDRIEKLEEIGMMWNIRKDTDTKKVLCDKHGIDSSLVENISYMELFAKINYLLDNNMDIIIDGKLNPIFFMSNENMMMNYGVSLKDMVNIYTKNKKAK